MESCVLPTWTSLMLIFASCCLVPNQVSLVLSGLSFSRFVDNQSSISWRQLVRQSDNPLRIVDQTLWCEQAVEYHPRTNGIQYPDGLQCCEGLQYKARTRVVRVNFLVAHHTSISELVNFHSRILQSVVEKMRTTHLMYRIFRMYYQYVEEGCFGMIKRGRKPLSMAMRVTSYWWRQRTIESYECVFHVRILKQTLKFWITIIEIQTQLHFNYVINTMAILNNTFVTKAILNSIFVFY